VTAWTPTLVVAQADSDTKTLKQRIGWEFEYTDLDIMLRE
jgi:hypothetical protein